MDYCWVTAGAGLLSGCIPHVQIVRASLVCGECELSKPHKSDERLMDAGFCTGGRARSRRCGKLLSPPARRRAGAHLPLSHVPVITGDRGPGSAGRKRGTEGVG